MRNPLRPSHRRAQYQLASGVVAQACRAVIEGHARRGVDGPVLLPRAAFEACSEGRQIALVCHAMRAGVPVAVTVEPR
jgi:hypothetical protein